MARVKVADTSNEIMATDDCLKPNWYWYNDIIHSLTHSLTHYLLLFRFKEMR